jgi:glycosyltransferase involved in cell wall biosynthesis
MQVAGAEVLIAEIIRRLRGRIEPTILCLDAVGQLGERLRDEGIAVECLHRRPGRDWRVPWRLARVATERQLQVVHAHQYTPFFYAALGRLLGRATYRLILTEHGRHYPDIVSPKRRRVNRWILSRYADAVNAVCRFSAEALAQNDGFRRRPVEVIENGIEWQRYDTQRDRAALRAKLGLDQARRYIAIVARFHPVKDHATLIRAFELVAKRHSDADLLLIGDGPLRPDLEAQVRSLHLDGRVNFMGVRSDVPDLLQAGDIFTLTSVSEAASLTLLEAMAAGLPVVVTDVGGNPEIVRPGVDGYLAPRGDAAGIADALNRLLANPQQAQLMGASGQQRVRDHYALDRTIERYDQLYRDLACSTK